MEFLILALKCAVVFVVGVVLFDTVHYILHQFEKSRWPLLRWLGGLHGVHHDFLDENMRIQRDYSRLNLLNHVIPEYLTSVIGMALLGFVFGWLPVVIVIAIRTVMVIVYVFQKGEDITHRELKRINGNRWLLFVGPHYHAFHHVYENQHYSSFVNVFDMVMGTNCQIAGRRFLILGSQSPFGSRFARELTKLGGHVQTELSSPEHFNEFDVLVLVLAPEAEASQVLVDKFISAGRNRLVPPEVWAADSILSPKEARAYFKNNDVTFRYLRTGPAPSPAAAARSLFLIRRGFCRIRAGLSLRAHPGSLK